MVVLLKHPVLLNYKKQHYMIRNIFISLFIFALVSAGYAQSVLKFYQKNGTVESFVISSIDSLKYTRTAKTLPTITDIDGNVYHYIKIGTQTWMVENLRTTRYRNGDIIPTTSPYTQNISTESNAKYQWPAGGNDANLEKYGRVYTGYAAYDSRNLAPTGWRVANAADWKVLRDYLQANGYNYDKTSDENKYAKSLASKTDWSSSSTVGTPGNQPELNNQSGFNGYPAGWRTQSGTFQYLGSQAMWWAIAEGLMYESGVNIYNSAVNVQGSVNYMNYAMSVRCIKE
jgi:uncharacterized protein (TIGR02145 family)